MSAQATLFAPEPTLAVPPWIGSATARAIETTHVLTPGKGRTGDYDFTLNPYRGCSFGCAYCYAAFFVADSDLRESWGQWVEAKVRAVEALKKSDLRGKRIYMSSVTDPYQPLEAKLGLTRSIVEELLAQGARLVVQTRSPLAARDIDLFRQFEHLRVNVSITTDSEAVRQEFEPNCASIPRRLALVKELKEAGLRVSVCLCPLLPVEDPIGFGLTLRKLGADHVAASWFHSSQRAYASSTRDEAWRLAEQHGWNRQTFERTVRAIRGVCPSLGTSSEAFAPV